MVFINIDFYVSWFESFVVHRYARKECCAVAFRFLNNLSLYASFRPRNVFCEGVSNLLNEPIHNLDAILAGMGIELSIENQVQYHCMRLGNKPSAEVMLVLIKRNPARGAVVLASNSGVKPHVGEGFILYFTCNIR